MENKIAKKLEVYDKNDGNYLTMVAEYTIQKDDSNGKVHQINGEFKENMGGGEYEHLFRFESNWELNVILDFEGMDYDINSNTPNKYKGHYETGNIYGLENLSIALQLISYITRHEIEPSGTYMYEDEVERIDNNPIWAQYDLKLLIQ